MTLDEARAALRGRRVLVTGGGGFVGGRLVERLVLECGAEVRVLVRNLAGAMRLARFALDFQRGDVLDRAALGAAVQDCEIVFHCAYGTSGSQRQRARVNRDGTRNVLEAAAAAGARRVVHLSTLMVYGRTGDGDLDERAPRRRFGNAYADSKLDAERLAIDFARRGRVPATVLQPTAVFGPYGGVWTERVLGSMKRGRQILVDGGNGLANFVYVDDLVSAMLLAAHEPRAVGECFLISAAEPVTWKEWFERFARMLGGERTVVMSEGEARAFARTARKLRRRLPGELVAALRGDKALRERLFETPELRGLREMASSLLPEGWQRKIKARLGMGAAPPPPPPPSGDLPIAPLLASEIDFFLPRTRVRIDKARDVLGYRPEFDLEAGMTLTEYVGSLGGSALGTETLLGATVNRDRPGPATSSDSHLFEHGQAMGQDAKDGPGAARVEHRNRQDAAGSGHREIARRLGERLVEVVERLVEDHGVEGLAGIVGFGIRGHQRVALVGAAASALDGRMRDVDADVALVAGRAQQIAQQAVAATDIEPAFRRRQPLAEGEERTVARQLGGIAQQVPVAAVVLRIPLRRRERRVAAGALPFPAPHPGLEPRPISAEQEAVVEPRHRLQRPAEDLAGKRHAVGSSTAGRLTQRPC